MPCSYAVAHTNTFQANKSQIKLNILLQETSAHHFHSKSNLNFIVTYYFQVHSINLSK